jgi:hypothetical protein
MIKYGKYMSLSLLFILFLNFTAWTQDSGEHLLRVKLQEVSLMDLEPSEDVEIELKSPIDAGMDFELEGNTTKWINYSSSVRENSLRKNISVSIAGALPEGVRLKILVGSALTGQGELGVNNPEQEISSVSTLIISGIGGAFTGTGEGKGHQLKYQLEITDYSALNEIQSESIMITYTISQ